MQYSQTTRQVADRFRAACDALLAIDMQAAPVADVDAALQEHRFAAEQLANAALADIDAAARR